MNQLDVYGVLWGMGAVAALAVLGYAFNLRSRFRVWSRFCHFASGGIGLGALAGGGMATYVDTWYPAFSDWVLNQTALPVSFQLFVALQARPLLDAMPFLVVGMIAGMGVGLWLWSIERARRGES